VIPNAKAENKFDGRWSAVLVTKSGSCQPIIRGEVEITEGIVRVAGDRQGALSGRVSANGQVVVTGSLGPISGVATGRLSADSGAGTWRAQLQDGPCSGDWSAQRQ
jgi:hypothetical protein